MQILEVEIHADDPLERVSYTCLQQTQNNVYLLVYHPKAIETCEQRQRLD
jgi:hypothetical protein